MPKYLTLIVKKSILFSCSFIITQLIYLLQFTSIRSSRLDVFCKKGVLRNFTKLTGNTCARTSILIKAWNFIKIETLAQVFSSKLCKISKSTFFYRTPPVAASLQSSFTLISWMPCRLFSSFCSWSFFFKFWALRNMIKLTKFNILTRF